MSRIVADQDELARIAHNLEAAKYLLEADLLANLLTHPVRSALIEVQLLDLILQVEQLHRDCLLVQQNLFGVEVQLAQNHNFLMADITKELGMIAATAFAAITGSGATARSSEVISSYTSNRLKDLAVKLEMAYSGSQARVRIDLNESKGYRQFTVYIPGLQNIGVPNRNPLDLASSTQQFSGLPNSAENAVKEALRQSGVGLRASDRLILVGHSLGGMIASNLAKDKNLNVDAVVTFGSPNDQFEVPKNIPVLNINHDDDPVTWLDGIVTHGSELGSSVQVDWGQKAEASSSNSLFASHDMSSYQKTAEGLDQNSDPKLQAIKDALREALGDGSVETRYYDISR